VITAELVQKFCCALPPQQSPLFMGLNFPLMVLLMFCSVSRRMDKLVQKFRRALPPQRSLLFMGLNFPLMVLLMLC
jgi:hypothetical protein